MKQDTITTPAPWLAVQSVKALQIGNALRSGPPLTPISALQRYNMIFSSEHADVERVLFGFRLPFVPSLLESDDLIGGDTKERVAEVLDDQSRLIHNLSKWHNAAFSLRYIYQPDSGQIGIVLIGRVLARLGLGEHMAGLIASDLERQLRSLHFTPVPIRSATELDWAVELTGLDSIVEIWQSQRLAFLTIERNHGLEEVPALVICPFRQPQAATWLSTFRAIATHEAPIAINVHIEPTDLMWFEAERLHRNAETAGSMLKYTIRRNTGDREVTSPVAAMVAQTYSESLRRLTAGRPYVMTVQVASTDGASAVSVAQQLAVELTEEHAFDLRGTDTSGTTPSGFEIIVPRSQEDIRAALLTLTELELHALTDSGTDQAGRSRYLVDAATASAAFRFPVPLRSGIPGIASQKVVPTNHYDQVRSLSESTDEPVLTIGTSGQDRVCLPLNQLTRHGLVAGTNGSGKTTTIMNLLDQLWRLKIPFLVIEPAKTEYRTLLQGPIGEDLRVYTLGDEHTAPFRLNPLEILPGIMVETHIGTVRACIESAMPQFGILPSLIEQSLRRAYFSRGWELSDRGEANDTKPMPTLGEFYTELVRSLEEREYSGPTHQDLRGAATGRIAPLLWGSKGKLLNTRRSFSIADLLSFPTVIELEAVNDEERALIMMFLLTAVREHCDATWGDGKLRHVIVVEEAHRVMSKVPHTADREVSADSRAKAVDLVIAALSELRALGEGIIVAEQIPGRLVEDALKNTNVKIIHRLPGADDRDTVGGTIGASAFQKAHIGELAQGEAAVFLPGYSQPAFARVPNYKEIHNLPVRLSNADVKSHMDRISARHNLTPFSACEHCAAICRYRDRVAEYAYALASVERFAATVKDWHSQLARGNDAGAWRAVAEACIDGIVSIPGKNEDVAFCYFSHLWKEDVSTQSAAMFRRALML